MRCDQMLSGDLKVTVVGARWQLLGRQFARVGTIRSQEFAPNERERSVGPALCGGKDLHERVAL